MFNIRTLGAILPIAAVLFCAGHASALTITGAVEKKYLLTGSPVAAANTHAVLKISFETLTGGENLALCAGTLDDFATGRCATQLNDSGGPGFRFLTIVDANDLSGKHLYVIREVGSNSAEFSFTIE